MTLPKVHVKSDAAGRGGVWINDEELPAVLGAQVTVKAGELPRVLIEVRAGEVTVDLPETGVQILRAGPTAADFAASLSPARLEQAALQRLDESTTHGEAFAAAVADAARSYDGG